MLDSNSTGGGNFFAANTIAAAIADTHPHLGIMIDGCETPRTLFRSVICGPGSVWLC